MDLFITNDCYGNTVSCSKKKWEEHITDGHSEMMTKEHVVKQIIEDPKAVLHQDYRSSKIFYSNDPTAIKPLFTAVVVTYNTQNSVTIGNVTTAYVTRKIKDDENANLEFRKI